jgi:hypothetical protein
MVRLGLWRLVDQWSVPLHLLEPWAWGHGAWWGVGGYRPYPRPVVYGGYRKTNININVDNSINIGGGNRPANRPNLYNRPETRDRVANRPAVPSDRQARPTFRTTC